MSFQYFSDETADVVKGTITEGGHGGIHRGLLWFIESHGEHFIPLQESDIRMRAAVAATIAYGSLMAGFLDCDDPADDPALQDVDPDQIRACKIVAEWSSQRLRSAMQYLCDALLVRYKRDDGEGLDNYSMDNNQTSSMIFMVALLDILNERGEQPCFPLEEEQNND